MTWPQRQARDLCDVQCAILSGIPFLFFSQRAVASNCLASSALSLQKKVGRYPLEFKICHSLVKDNNLLNSQPTKMKSRRRPKVWTSRSKTASPPKLGQEKVNFDKQEIVFEKPTLVKQQSDTWESYRTDKFTVTTTQKTEKKKSVQTKRSKDMPMNVTINLSDEENAG